MDVLTVPTETATEVITQIGAILVALITGTGAAVVSWLHGRRAGEKAAGNAGTIAKTQEDKLHQHLTANFNAQMDAAREHYESILQQQREHYESILTEQHKLHEERTRRMEELAAEVHELRAEVRHLQDTLTAHGIPIPRRNAG